MKKNAIFFIVLLISLCSSAFAQDDSLLGETAYTDGDYLKAIKLFSSAINNGEVNQENWRFLGMAFARLKKHDFARKAFKRADKLKRRKSDDTYKHYKIVKSVYARHTRESNDNRVQGEVRVAIEFLKDGSIGFTYPYKKLPHGLTKNVVEAFRKIKFEPAERNGKKITVVGVLFHRFRFN